jgi:disulfide oxidoreductase YuzD
MSFVTQHINRVLQPLTNEGRVARLYPELMMSIKSLVVSKEYICSLNEVLDVMELIENGQVMDPIIINDTNLIIDGNKRYYAFKRLGYKNVTVIKQQLNRNDLNGNEFSILNDIN